MTTNIDPAGAVFKRDLSHGAIAGTVVGVVVAAALLLFCLYPFVVHHIKRRKQARRPKLDAEAGANPDLAGDSIAPGPSSHRRLSSTDSFKQNGDLARGDFGGSQSKELSWPPSNGAVTQPNVDLGPSRQFSGQTHDGSRPLHGLPNANFPNDYEADPASFPYYFENTPAARQDGAPGVLRGTSADYYSPSIPSEAFGMVTTTEPAEPPRKLSRGSSLKHNISHMFRRQSGHDNALATSTQAHPATELGQIIITRQPTDSPIEFSPTRTSMPPPPVPELTESFKTDSSASPPRPTAQTPPAQSPPPDRSFKASPSPPTFPAPGTVNPMDIMPASTESEMWHRTEHQLHASSYGSSPGVSSLGDPAEQREHLSALASSPPATASSPPDVAEPTQSSTPTNQDAVLGLQKTEEMDVPMAEAHSHNHLSPSMIPDSGRHQSYASDNSTQYHGPHSTGPSTENTPSTQFDSPSPGSMNSSEIRNSASPQPGLASPKVGLFRCDEPGCSQVFDQPHKLK
jgi:hypothetical protein